MVKLSECTFRKLREEDLPVILEWRNAPRVRQAMYTDHVIRPEEHARWFARIAADPTGEHFLFCVAGTPAGVFNVTQINPYARTCSWAFYASETAPRGSGVAMELTAIDYMSQALRMRKINCEVLAFNEPVIKLHKRFGFEEEGVFKAHILRDGAPIDAVRLALFTERWPAIRERLAAALLGTSSVEGRA